MILAACIITALVIIAVIYIIHGVYIKSFEFEGSIKGFKLKLETNEKSAPSSKE
ncbi:MAG: hypothetical protein ABRQ27_15615 [Clostridiaceae bacterium]